MDLLFVAAAHFEALFFIGYQHGMGKEEAAYGFCGIDSQKALTLPQLVVKKG